MNIVEKKLDAYEISDNLYNNTIISPNDIITIEECDLKSYFEMLIIIFMEGMYKFCRYAINDNNKFNLNALKESDIFKINSYFQKINIQLHFKIFHQDEWTINKYKSYNQIEINSNTNLEELHAIFYVSPNVYVVNFTSYIE
jgi:uncharacterized protein YqkB